jgi:hypothetical protein
VGLAYRLTSKTVLRSAFGTSFDAPPWNIAVDLAANPPEAISTAFTNSQFDFTDAQAASQGFSRPAAGVIAGSALEASELHPKTETVFQWNAAVEQQLPASVLLTVAYVGTKGTHLYLQPDINQAVPGTGAVASRRPFSSFQAISQLLD